MHGERFDVFSIEGMKPVDPKLLEPFEHAMEHEVIPEVVKVLEERAIAAEESRRRMI